MQYVHSKCVFFWQKLSDIAYSDSARATFSRQISNGGKRVELGGIGGSRGVKGEVGCMGLSSPDGTNLLLLLLTVIMMIIITTLMVIMHRFGSPYVSDLLFNSCCCLFSFPTEHLSSSRLEYCFEAIRQKVKVGGDARRHSKKMFDSKIEFLISLFQRKFPTSGCHKFVAAGTFLANSSA